MNSPQKASLLLGIASISVASYQLGLIVQHKKDAKIMRAIGEEIKSIFRAYAEVQRGIARGEYTDKDLIGVEERFEFAIIAQHLK